MGSSLKKLLARFDKRERKDIEVLIKKVCSFDVRAMDVKKLKGYRDIFRVRKGNIRIIYQVQGERISILTIERRSESTYKF